MRRIVFASELARLVKLGEAELGRKDTDPWIGSKVRLGGRTWTVVSVDEGRLALEDVVA